MAMLDRCQVIPGKPLVDEQPHLLDIPVAQLLAQSLPHGMGAGLGHSGEDETVAMRNDHVSAHRERAPTSPGEVGRVVRPMGPAQNL